MQAITYSRYGPPGVLEVREVPEPIPGPGQVRIRVRAVEATKGDCELRSFRFAVKWFWLPLRLAWGVFAPRRRILGSYFAGVIDSCGAEVAAWAPGDEVFGSAGLSMGAYGRYVCLSARAALATKPANMSFVEAAAVPLGGLNALHFMHKAQVAVGERVLINGAGGSIGLHAVQFAKSMGAHVTAVDARHKAELLRSHGADVFVDYAAEDFTKRGDTYHVIFDMVPQSSFGACMRLLERGGRYLNGNPRLSVMLRCLLTSWFTDKTATCAFAKESKAELSELREKVEAGQVRSIVDAVYPMDQAAAAHRRVESEERLGAVVIKVA